MNSIFKNWQTILLVVVICAFAYFVFSEKMDSTENIRMYPEQHALIKGTWVMDGSEDTSEGFHLLHAFDYGKTYTGGSYDENGKGLGYYEITEVRDDGSFDMVIRSDWYGYKSNMNITPTDDPEEIKIYTQTYRKISDYYKESR